MRELRLVAMSDDGTRLILRAEGDESPMALPLDERLYAALRGDRARLGQLEIQLNSRLRPRDIQARVRAGDDVQAVAAAAGVPLDRVLRFAGPVLAERQHVAERARTAVIRRASGENLSRPLAEAVADWVEDRGAEPEAITWDAWRRDDGKWQISAAWKTGKSDRSAMFTFDPTGRSVQPDDDEARAIAGERAERDEASEAVPEPVPGPARLSVLPGGGGDDADIAEYTPLQVAPDIEAPPVPAADADSDDEPTVPVPVISQDDASVLPEAPRHEQTQPQSQATPSRRAEGQSEHELAQPAEITSVNGSDQPRPAPEPRPVPEARPAAESRPVASSRPAPDTQPDDSDASRRPRRAAASSRSRRPSVPSWDEIMFGRRRQD